MEQEWEYFESNFFFWNIHLSLIPKLMNVKSNYDLIFLSNLLRFEPLLNLWSHHSNVLLCSCDCLPQLGSCGLGKLLILFSSLKRPPSSPPILRVLSQSVGDLVADCMLSFLLVFVAASLSRCTSSGSPGSGGPYFNLFIYYYFQQNNHFFFSKIN